jgi:hypothetical protein
VGDKPLARSFLILGQRVRVACPDAAVVDLLLANYGALLASADAAAPDLQYVVDRGPRPGAYALACRGRAPVAAGDAGSLLFHLEKDVTVALQERRPDLLFLHAAALERGGKAYVLAGESGHGKSTTTWGLLHHGFRYLSDELSPIDLRSLQVWPYPHALCLKRSPPPDYPLPEADVIDLGATRHVPVHALPGALAPGPCAVAALLFVRFREGAGAPALRPLSTAEATARLYVNALNLLAHPARGLDAVADVAARIPCFSFDAAADLGATCHLVARLAEGAALPARS